MKIDERFDKEMKTREMEHARFNNHRAFRLSQSF